MAQRQGRRCEPRTAQGTRCGRTTWPLQQGGRLRNPSNSSKMETDEARRHSWMARGARLLSNWNVRSHGIHKCGHHATNAACGIQVQPRTQEFIAGIYHTLKCLFLTRKRISARAASARGTCSSTEYKGLLLRLPLHVLFFLAFLSLSLTPYGHSRLEEGRTMTS